MSKPTAHPKRRHRPHERSSRRTLKALSASVGVTSLTVALAVGLTSGAPTTDTAQGESASRPVEATAAILDVPSESLVDRSELDAAIEAFSSRRGTLSLDGLSLGALQRQSAKVQSEFVEASLLYDQIATGASQARKAAEVAEKAADEAEKEVTATKDQFVEHLSVVYTSELALHPSLQMLATKEDAQEDVASGVVTGQKYLDESAHSVHRLDVAREKADESLADAESAKDEAESYEGRIAELVKAIEARSDDIAQMTATVMAKRGESPVFSQAEQDARNGRVH